MRSHRMLHPHLIAASLVAALMALPFAQTMAQDTSAQTAAPSSTSQSSSSQAMSGTTDDSSITAKVKSEFVAAKHVKASDITVSTTGGVVTLTGTASSAREKNDAVRIARKVKGVKSVDASGLTVGAASTGGSTPASGSSSGL
jgi:hyperosmotically inducible periplasmic protein